MLVQQTWLFQTLHGLERQSEEGKLSLAGFIFVNRRVTAIEILQGVQGVLEREIFVLYHSTRKCWQRANLGWIPFA